ncbi:prolyl aminopeptidase [Thalassomonas actiniarum]|uniref:Proline iminopeptidase n=1 Tax=Thalassomonas actiniarum TaxID=485447 RepID=A0AAE9YQI6_9GAMM|nr:prolyl aminopeptidase [Thalassomonas actiniarum]WDD98418.1 prolyl aminopeptidase [Thalassomonas actiniarum]
MSRTLYPKISVTSQQWLDVGDGHQIYLEQSGNEKGIPVVYFHGGPGGGSSENHRRYFDPQLYRIILFDQRGCGRSKPSPSIENNTLDHLIEDIELIREHLGIKQWLVTGGSWGTTLALAYGIRYPARVLGFILRGVFLASTAECDWLYKPGGASCFYPEYYREFAGHLGGKYNSDVLGGYHQLLSSENEVAVIAASKAWYLWELRLSTIEHAHIGMAQVEDTHQALCMAVISSFYFTRQCFMDENYILDNISQIQDIPAILLHGRYDMVCQLHIADQLCQQWRNAQLQILPCAGHSGFETQTIDAFCKATDTMANFLTEKES